MNDFSLVDKLKILMNVILSSPLFLIIVIGATIMLVFFAVTVVSNIKINKYVFIGVWVLFGLIILIKYNKIFIELIDNFFNFIFSALYFPGVAEYIILLIISNFFFAYSIFTKKILKYHKIINITTTLMIDALLIIIMDIVNTNNINIYDKVTIFSNSNLLVLLELSTAIFTSWLLLNILISAKHKLKKLDKKETPEMPEIIFD